MIGDDERRRFEAAHIGMRDLQQAEMVARAWGKIPDGFNYRRQIDAEIAAGNVAVRNPQKKKAVESNLRTFNDGEDILTASEEADLVRYAKRGNQKRGASSSIASFARPRRGLGRNTAISTLMTWLQPPARRCWWRSRSMI
jgi:hypothetical protein